MSQYLPFTTFVDLPGASPGDKITPCVEHVGYEWIDPIVLSEQEGEPFEFQEEP